MRWVTGCGAGLDALACAWLIRRFIDREADILFAPEGKIPEALERGFIPFHVPGHPLAPANGQHVFPFLVRQSGFKGGALGRLSHLIDQALCSPSMDTSPLARGLAALHLGFRFDSASDASNLGLLECVLDALISPSKATHCFEEGSPIT